MYGQLSQEVIEQIRAGDQQPANPVTAQRPARAQRPPRFVRPQRPVRRAGRRPGLCMYCLSRTCVHVVGPQRAHLTPRQVDIARLLSEGLANKQIAAELGLTEGSVKVYVSRLFVALRLDSRLRVALWARDHAAALLEPAA